jgi:anaerobic magnesium-protoporphyrin IX monomethyl ester cyclase
MKVLLVSPPILDVVRGRLQAVGVDAERECPAVGIYSLAAVLEQSGHEVAIADLVLEGTRSLDGFERHLDAVDLVGVGATSMAWPTAVDVIRQVRARRPEVPIVCGGIHPTLFDRYVLSNFPVEFVVRGEGEHALERLCAALEGRAELSEVPNLSFKAPDGKVLRNGIGPQLQRDALGALPLPDYARLPPGGYKCLGLESSRGCSYDCSFCSTPYRRSWRALDAEVFVDRLEAVLSQLDRTTSGCVHIVDDEFSLNPGRATAIARRIRSRNLKPRLLFDSRAADLLREGFVESIAEYTVCLLVGAECGYDEGLEKVGKGSTCVTLEAAAKVLAQNGIAHRVDFSFILGLPWESKAEVERTIRFATHLHATYGVHVMMQWYRQIPGSRIWQDARDAQLVHEAMYDGYGFFRDLHLFRTSCRLTPSEIYEIADMADQLRWLSELSGRKRPAIIHHFPSPVALGFPRDQLDSDGVGLHNVRDISQRSGKAFLKLEGTRA